MYLVYLRFLFLVSLLFVCFWRVYIVFDSSLIWASRLKPEIHLIRDLLHCELPLLFSPPTSRLYPRNFAFCTPLFLLSPPLPFSLSLSPFLSPSLDREIFESRTRRLTVDVFHINVVCYSKAQRPEIRLKSAKFPRTRWFRKVFHPQADFFSTVVFVVRLLEMSVECDIETFGISRRKRERTSLFLSFFRARNRLLRRKLVVPEIRDAKINGFFFLNLIFAKKICRSRNHSRNPVGERLRNATFSRSRDGTTGKRSALSQNLLLFSPVIFSWFLKDFDS